MVVNQNVLNPNFGDTRLRLGSWLAARYRSDGFVAPIRALGAGAARQALAATRSAMDRMGTAPTLAPDASEGRLVSLMGADGLLLPPVIECRHLDDPAVLRLCMNPIVLEAVRAVLGDDLLLWRSTVIVKRPGGQSYDWHQDWGGIHTQGTEYGLEPPLHCTVWLALTDVGSDNGCLQFVPGIHGVLPTTVPPEAPNATPMPILDRPVEGAEVPLQAGEFVLFSDRALHASGANTTAADRVALAMRFTVPFVAVRPHFEGHRIVLVVGRDTVGANEGVVDGRELLATLESTSADPTDRGDHRAELDIVDWCTAEEIDGAAHAQRLHVDLGRRPAVVAASTATGQRLVSNGWLGADILRLAAGDGFRPHTHPGDHLLIVLGGQGTITYDGRVSSTKAGQIYMVAGQVPHAVGAITDHVILAVGSPHRPVDSPDRMALVEYAAVLSQCGDMHCLICDIAVEDPSRLHTAGCPHCPCERCVQGSSQ